MTPVYRECAWCGKCWVAHSSQTNEAGHYRCRACFHWSIPTARGPATVNQAGKVVINPVTDESFQVLMVRLNELYTQERALLSIFRRAASCLGTGRVSKIWDIYDYIARHKDAKKLWIAHQTNIIATEQEVKRIVLNSAVKAFNPEAQKRLAGLVTRAEQERFDASLKQERAGKFREKNTASDTVEDMLRDGTAIPQDMADILNRVGMDNDMTDGMEEELEAMEAEEKEVLKEQAGVNDDSKMDKEQVEQVPEGAGKASEGVGSSPVEATPAGAGPVAERMADAPSGEDVGDILRCRDWTAEAVGENRDNRGQRGGSPPGDGGRGVHGQGVFTGKADEVRISVPHGRKKTGAVAEKGVQALGQLPEWEEHCREERED